MARGMPQTIATLMATTAALSLDFMAVTPLNQLPQPQTSIRYRIQPVNGKRDPLSMARKAGGCDLRVNEYTAKRVLIDPDCSAIAGCRKRRARIACSRSLPPPSSALARDRGR